MLNWVYGSLLILLISNSVLALDFNEDNLTLLDAEFEHQRIGSGLDVYLEGGTYYMALVDLIALLEMDISTQAHRAAGKLTAIGPSFSLTHSNNTWIATIDERQNTVSPESVVIYDGLIYITPILAKQWFGITLELNLPESIIHLESPLNLPFKQRLQRQSNRISSQRTLPPSEHPVLHQSYSLTELPSIAVRLNQAVRNNINNDKVQSSNSTYYSVATNGDMLGMNTQTLWTGLRDKGLNSVTVEMNRYDHTQSMLGPMGLSQISIGDISHPTFGGAPGSYGRGITIGNSSISINSNRDIRDIEGDYLPEWEVELYLSGALIGFQKTDSNGHYKFKDVILFEGDNNFTLKFYGPNGRIETKEQHILLGADNSSKHPISYGLSFSQPGKRVYDINNDETDNENIDQAVFTTGFHPSRKLNINMGILKRRTEEANDQYQNTSIKTNILGANLSISTSKKNNEAPSYSYSIGGAILNTRYRLSQSKHLDSNSYSLAINRKFGKNTNLVFRSLKNTSLSGSNEEHKAGLSGRLRSINWNHSLNYKSDESTLHPEDDYEYLNGSLFLAKSFYPTNLRMSLGYNVLPDTELVSTALSISARLDKNTKINFTSNHSLVNHNTRYRLSMNWRLKYMLLTPSISYSDNGWLQGIITISASLGRRNGRVGNYYHLSSKHSLTKGAIKARLFEDENQDNSYQLGEPLLSGGKVHAIQGRRKGETNKGGITWLDTLQPWQPTDIIVEDDSIESDSMRQSIKPFSIIPRPGKIMEIDIPFTRVGDMDGTVYRNEDVGLEPARGMTVLLINSKGEMIQQQATDSDGYFDFTKIAPSVYTLSVKGEPTLSTTHSTATITAQGNYVAGVEITIGKAPEAENPLESLFKESPKTEPISPPPTPSTEAFPVESVPILTAEPVDEITESEPEKIQAPATISIKETSPTTMGEWSLQAASYSSHSAAQKFVGRITQKNKTAFIKQAVINNKTFYRVYIGRFSTKRDALKEKTIIDKTFNIQSIVSKPQ